MLYNKYILFIFTKNLKHTIMKTLELILKGYCNGEYTLNEMQVIVNETMQYCGYKMAYGKRYLKAIISGELIEVSI